MRLSPSHFAQSTRAFALIPTVPAPPPGTPASRKYRRAKLLTPPAARAFQEISSCLFTKEQWVSAAEGVYNETYSSPTDAMRKMGLPMNQSMRNSINRHLARIRGSEALQALAMMNKRDECEQPESPRDVSGASKREPV